MRIDNITDWSLKQFASHYKAGPGNHGFPSRPRKASSTTSTGCIHDPAYREKYAQNLKRDFPRAFHSTAPPAPTSGAGLTGARALMDLHIGYEQAARRWPLKRTDTPDAKVRAAGQTTEVAF